MELTDKIYIEGASGGKEYALSSIHTTEGRIFLTEHIDMKSATKLVSIMKYTAMEMKDITLYINSSGGDVEAGLLMYDMIQEYPYGLDIFCIGMASSMASILLASGKKGHRYILPHSKVLIHEPLIAEGFGGSATNIDKTAQRILDVKAQLNNILAKHTGRTIDEINQATSFDNIMTAEEAIKFGLCDEIRNVY